MIQCSYIQVLDKKFSTRSSLSIVSISFDSALLLGDSDHWFDFTKQASVFNLTAACRH